MDKFDDFYEMYKGTLNDIYVDRKEAFVIWGMCEKIENDMLKLISTVLYRAYSMPYKRNPSTKNYQDSTYVLTDEEMDKCRKMSLVMKRIGEYKNHIVVE